MLYYAMEETADDKAIKKAVEEMRKRAASGKPKEKSGAKRNC